MDHNSAEGVEALDDPLPSVENLMISGYAIPGQEIQACGFKINGTTSCKFMWLRGSDESSMNYIEGAETAYYTVTEDDVNLYLAIEVIPIDDDKNRTGQTIRVFANDKNIVNQAQQ